MHRNSLPWVVAVALAAGACGDSTGPEAGALIDTQLIRLEGSASPALAMGGSGSSHEDGYAWSSDLEITSFETPIRAIWLEGDAEGSESLVYECEADTNDGCLVDLAGPALQDLLGADPVMIREGTYNTVVVSTCEEEGEYTGYLTGSVALGGQAYVTKTADVWGTDGTAEPVSVAFSGCQRSYPVPEPVVVSDTLGEEISFRLYFDIRDLAWGSLGETDTAGGWIPGGCAGASDTPYLCVAYPDVAGVVDDVAPELERYRINDGATLGLIFQASNGAYVGGYVRRYFQEHHVSSPGFTADTPVETFSDNGDGSWRLETYGGSDGSGTGPVGHYLTIPAFVRDTHGGMALDFSGNEFQYSAQRIE